MDDNAFAVLAARPPGWIRRPDPSRGKEDEEDWVVRLDAEGSKGSREGRPVRMTDCPAVLMPA
jgi:hypothetical protein